MSEYYSYDNRGPIGFLANIPPVTRNLFIINVIFFIATAINREFMILNFAMFDPATPYFRIWQPITYMFMHAGFWHIFANMWGLLIFGSALERTIGTKKYAFLYFLSGFGALGLHTLIQVFQAPGMIIPMLGASGALFGVQVAYAMLFPNNVWTLVFPPVSLKAKWFIALFIGIELFTGVTGTIGGVAHFAHLGGALVGFLLMLYWKKTGTLWRN